MDPITTPRHHPRRIPTRALVCFCAFALGACQQTSAPASTPVSLSSPTPAPEPEPEPASDFAFAAGGLRLEYVLEADPGAPADAIKQAQSVIKRRLDALGVQANVSVIGKHLVLDLPGTTAETVEAVRHEVAIGKLEIRELDDGPTPADKLPPPGTLELPATMLDGSTKLVRLRPGGLGSAQVEDADVRMTDMGVVVDVRFNAAGAAKFEKLTRDNLDKPIAIVLDGKIMTMPVVKTPIVGGRVQITMGGVDREKQRAEAEALVRALEAGALHGKLVLESEYTVPARR